MEHIVVERQLEFSRPVVVLAFRGWNDAGDAATGAIEWLSGRWGARRFAHVDPEDFYDFQVARPTVQLLDGVTRRIEWPQNVFSHARVGGRDIVLFLGIEPNTRWRTYTDEVVGFGRSLGADRMVTLGAFLADVAHTLPVPVVGSAGDAEEAERLGLTPSRYEGPTGIVGVLSDTATRASVPCVSFWAAIPHYVSSGENPKATMALLRRFASLLDLDVDLSDLEPSAAAWEDSVTQQVHQNEALLDYIRGLEEAGEDEPIEPAAGGLAEEIERFLEERGGEG